MFKFLQRRKEARPVQAANRFQPRLEELETREVPALTAKASVEVLYIRPPAGDTAADNVTITQINNTSFQVRGVTLPAKFAKLGYIPFKGINTIVVDLGGGTNTLTLRADAGFDTSLPPGGGVRGAVKVKGGSGNDTVTFSNNTIVYGPTNLNLGDGDNTVNLGSTAGNLVQFLGGIQFTGGAGVDRVTTTGNVQVDNLWMNLKDGKDSVSLASTTINKGLTVALGTGDDVITLSRVTVNTGSVSVSCGEGDDSMTVIGCVFNDRFYTPAFAGLDGFDALDLIGNANKFKRGFSTNGFDIVF